MQIKLATVADILLIQQLSFTIWPVAYKNIISLAQIHYMLELMYSSKALQAQMDKGHQFIIAIDDAEKAIGYASFSKKEDEANTIFRLNKIYVLPNQFTKRIGTALLNFIIENIKNKQASILELNVNKQNPAITFYQNNGFTILKEEIIDIGNGFVMDDYVMQKLL